MRRAKCSQVRRHDRWSATRRGSMRARFSSAPCLKEAEEIAAGASKSVTYTFDGDGPYAYGDQIADHYAKGAKGDVVLQP